MAAEDAERAPISCKSGEKWGTAWGGTGTRWWGWWLTRSFAPPLCARLRLKQFAEEVEFQCPAPKGASDFKRLAVSLKRYPNTKRVFQQTGKPEVYQSG